MCGLRKDPPHHHATSTRPPETCLKLMEVLVLTPLSHPVRGMEM